MTGGNGTVYCLIRIDDEKCTRCYTCIAHCSTDALRLDKGHFIHMRCECTYDEVCMDVCPNGALKILEM